MASILIQDNGLWAVTDDKGNFKINNVPTGTMTLTVRCLGYATANVSVDVKEAVSNLSITLKEDNLRLNEVQVVARRADRSPTISLISPLCCQVER